MDHRGNAVETLSKIWYAYTVLSLYTAVTAAWRLKCFKDVFGLRWTGRRPRVSWKLKKNSRQNALCSCSRMLKLQCTRTFIWYNRRVRHDLYNIRIIIIYYVVFTYPNEEYSFSCVHGENRFSVLTPPLADQLQLMNINIYVLRNNNKSYSVHLLYVQYS